jgi:hypothetical protein
VAPARPAEVSDPVAAEATGQQHIVATYRKHEYKLPLDVDDWPLHLIRSGQFIDALEVLLGDQWDAFLFANPQTEHVLPSSNAFAAAVGLPADKSARHPKTGKSVDVAFGAIPRLLIMLEKFRTAIDSDLEQFWHLDYRDRFRFDVDGRRRLTLRKIHDRILLHLPAESATAIAMGTRTPVQLLLMDLYEGITRTAHPSRPLTADQRRERQDAKKKTKDEHIADYKRRHKGSDRRAAAIESAQENALRGKAQAHAQQDTDQTEAD